MLCAAERSEIAAEVLKEFYAKAAGETELLQHKQSGRLTTSRSFFEPTTLLCTCLVHRFRRLCTRQESYVWRTVRAYFVVLLIGFLQTNSSISIVQTFMTMCEN